jgi:hypothetical protein
MPIRCKSLSRNYSIVEGIPEEIAISGKIAIILALLPCGFDNFLQKSTRNKQNLQNFNSNSTQNCNFLWTTGAFYLTDRPSQGSTDSRFWLVYSPNVPFMFL